VPVEEFQVPLAGGVGAAVLILRAWVESRVASKRTGGSTDDQSPHRDA
jgi:hypothetical protein